MLTIDSSETSQTSMTQARDIKMYILLSSILPLTTSRCKNFLYFYDVNVSASYEHIIYLKC